MNEEVASIFLALKLDNQSLRNQVNSAGTESGNSFATKFSNTMGNVFRYKLASTILSSVQQIWNYWTTGADEAYEKQLYAEEKLAEVMKTRMNATKEQIQDIKDYASELQQIGVVGDEVTLQGAAQLATFLNNKESLKALIKSMDDLAVNNANGFDVNDTTSVANMLGKAMAQNSLSSLTRVGITVTDEEEATFKSITDEVAKAEYLSGIIHNNVGDINEALAKTTAGQLKQASNTAGDIKERIGDIFETFKSSFLPFTNEFLLKFDTMVAKIQSFAHEFKNFMIELGYIQPTEAADEYAQSIKKGTAAIEEQEEKLSELGLAGFDVFNTIGNTTKNINDEVLNNSGKGLIDEEAVEESKKMFQGFFDNLLALLRDQDGPWAHFKNIVSNAWTHIKNVFTPVYEHLKENIKELINEHVPALGEAFGRLCDNWNDLWDTIDGDSFLVEWVNGWLDHVEGVLDRILYLIESIVNTAAGIPEFLQDPGGYLKEHIVEPWDNLGETINEELGNWQQNNYDKAVDNGKLFGFIDARTPINTSNANNNKVELSEESIKQLASAISRKNTAVQSQPIYIDGKKLTGAIVGTINKSSKYNNGSALRRY